jgi:hypothetical protein
MTPSDTSLFCIFKMKIITHVTAGDALDLSSFVECWKDCCSGKQSKHLAVARMCHLLKKKFYHSHPSTVLLI